MGFPRPERDYHGRRFKTRQTKRDGSTVCANLKFFRSANHIALSAFLCAHTHCIRAGCGKRRAHINWSMGLPELAASVNRVTLMTTGPVRADS